MSFQLSPQAVLFDLERRIKEINEEIALLSVNLVELPERIFQKVFVDFGGLITEVANQGEIDRAATINRQINDFGIFPLIEEKKIILRQIPVIQADIEAKTISTIISQPVFETGQQDNSLRNLLIAVGIILVVI